MRSAYEQTNTEWRKKRMIVGNINERITLLEAKVEFLLMVLWECPATRDAAKEVEERLDWEENDIEG